MAEEKQEQNLSGLSQLKQFELFCISRFLTFPELACFFQLAPIFAAIKPIIKQEGESNLSRLKSVPDQDLGSTMRKALDLRVLSPGDLKCADLLNSATLRLV